MTIADYIAIGVLGCPDPIGRSNVLFVSRLISAPNPPRPAPDSIDQGAGSSGDSMWTYHPIPDPKRQETQCTEAKSCN